MGHSGEAYEPLPRKVFLKCTKYIKLKTNYTGIKLSKYKKHKLMT